MPFAFRVDFKFLAPMDLFREAIIDHYKRPRHKGKAGGRRRPPSRDQTRSAAMKSPSI